MLLNRGRCVRPALQLAALLMLEVVAGCTSAGNVSQGDVSRTPQSSARQEVTTVIITRHAEKASPTADPDLSPAGRERAATLASALKPYEITTTIATRTRRAIQTAEPTIAAFIIPAERAIVLPPSTSPAALAAIIRSRPSGESILVVSHSNVIPPLLAELGIERRFTMAESDYDQIFVVTMTPASSALTHAGPLPLPARESRARRSAPIVPAQK